MIERLPNGDRAQVDISKLRDYCLNPMHPRGRHKAHVFREALGLTQANAFELRSSILKAAQIEPARELAPDAWGRRWELDFAVSRQNRGAVIRTRWLVRSGEIYPRFVSGWVL
jgi:hypothetical protein